MPVVSKRQNRFFQAHKGDKGKLGAVAREFTSGMKPGSVKKLPESKSDEKPRGDRWYGAKE